MSSTPSVPTWKIEFNKRLEAFAEAIGVPLDKVQEIFTELGADGEAEQSLTIIDTEEFLPINDLFSAFVDSDLTKKARLRAAMPHLRGKTYLGDTADVANGSLAQAIHQLSENSRPVASLSDAELLDRYTDNSTEVWKVLRERTHGRPCIVFNKDGSINKEASLELIRAARKQPTPDKYNVGGQLVRVYRAGDFPAKPLEESPFFRNVALVNGYCPRSNTDWSNVDKTMRILVRLACEVDNLTSTKKDMKQVHKDATKMTVEEFRAEYSEAALLYDEREAKGDFPTLTVMPSQVQERYAGNTDTGF
jgi:hypothetical protein